MKCSQSTIRPSAFMELANRRSRLDFTLRQTIVYGIDSTAPTKSSGNSNTPPTRPSLMGLFLVFTLGIIHHLPQMSLTGDGTSVRFSFTFFGVNACNREFSSFITGLDSILPRRRKTVG